MSVMHPITLLATSVVAILAASCAQTPPVPLAPPVNPEVPVATVVVPPAPPVALPVKVALALGGGAARGFAHVGVIKVLEANGIVPDIIVGTSAGSVVGALYAYGRNAAQLQAIAQDMQEAEVGDWSLPDRGVIKGEALQNFVNRAVNNRPIEKLNRLFGVVATDLRSGDQLVFRTGNTGLAVRASSAVPGVFKPVNILGREYVDGGLVSPVPVKAARDMGANFVIAVDISSQPKDGLTKSTIDVLLQTFTIMGQTITRYETPSADVLIRPVVSGLSATDFTSRKRAILEGEKAATAMLASIITRLDAMRFPRAGLTLGGKP